MFRSLSRLAFFHYALVSTQHGAVRCQEAQCLFSGFTICSFGCCCFINKHSWRMCCSKCAIQTEPFLHMVWSLEWEVTHCMLVYLPWKILWGNHHQCSLLPHLCLGIAKRNNSHLHDNVWLIGLGKIVCNLSSNRQGQSWPNRPLGFRMGQHNYSMSMQTKFHLMGNKRVSVVR